MLHKSAIYYSYFFTLCQYIVKFIRCLALPFFLHRHNCHLLCFWLPENCVLCFKKRVAANHFRCTYLGNGYIERGLSHGFTVLMVYTFRLYYNALYIHR